MQHEIITINMFSFKKIVGVALLVSSLNVSGAFASGSEGLGSATTGAAHMYNMGKRIYAEKIICKACPLAGKMLDKTSAAELLEGKGMAEKTFTMLSQDEQAALGVFLKRRFKL